MLTTNAGRLWLIGLIESISFLALVLIAMPLKYMAGRPEAVQIIGAAHGALWVLYILALVIVWNERKWPFWVAALGVIASMIPLGPLLFDA